LLKTVRHPTDATEVRQFSGKRPMFASSPALLPGGSIDGEQLGHNDRSFLQDPRGAIRHRDHPPKQD
jgi:hypothetical protein